jgi:membrane protein DedA with SNARE-associated domain
VTEGTASARDERRPCSLSLCLVFSLLTTHCSLSEWLDRLARAVLAVIAALGPWGVFALMAAEQACLPIPSEITLLAAGFLASEGRAGFALPIVIAAGIAGALTGASISYLVARRLGRPILQRYGRYLLITPPRLDAVTAWTDRHGWKAVLFCRWITGLRALVSLPAGLAHMPYPKFLALTALGSGGWVVAGVLIGWLVGEEWQRILHLVKRANYIALIAIIVIALVCWLIHRATCHSERSEESRHDRNGILHDASRRSE